MINKWSSLPFEKCLEKVKYTKKIQRRSFLDSGRFPVVSQEAEFVNGFWDNEADLYRVKTPVTIFGDHSKILKFVDFDFVLGADGVKILAPKDFLYPKFFYYHLHTANLEALGYARHYRLLKELEIHYPPLPEQRRIVRILDEAFAAIDVAKANTETNRRNTRALFDSHLHYIFSEKGKEWDRLTLAEMLEKGWIKGHLDGNHGGDYPRKNEFIDHGVPYISAKCLVGERVDLEKAKYLSPDRAAKLRKGIAQNNDVLFAHNATVGPVAILKTDADKIILGTSLTYYRCNLDYILPEYLAHFMRSSEFKDQYKQVMRQSTRNQVPITKQREFFHIVPPIRDQMWILKSLDGLLLECRNLESVLQQKLDTLEELKTSLLNQAFTGAL